MIGYLEYAYHYHEETKMVKTKIKPLSLLNELRKSVSEVFDVPFTKGIDHQVFKPYQKELAIWAANCAERVLPFFEEKCPNDARPRRAIDALQEWIRTDRFRMKTIREASLAAHAAAKTVKEDDAIFAAHSAGQAVGTAHVNTHSLGAALYAIRAVATHTGNVDDGLVAEYERQMKVLRRIVEERQA